MSYLMFAVLSTVVGVAAIAGFGERLSEKWATQLYSVCGVLMGISWRYLWMPDDSGLMSRVLFLVAGVGFAYLLMKFVRKVK